MIQNRLEIKFRIVYLMSPFRAVKISPISDISDEVKGETPPSDHQAPLAILQGFKYSRSSKHI
jgi:hypothetical protein